jgi:acyl carrier protein
LQVSRTSLESHFQKTELLAPTRQADGRIHMTVEELFCEVVEIAPSDLSENTSRANTQGWSSLAHINLITAIEEVYGVLFTTREIQSLNTFGDLCRLLREKEVYK